MENLIVKGVIKNGYIFIKTINSNRIVVLDEISQKIIKYSAEVLTFSFKNELIVNIEITNQKTIEFLLNDEFLDSNNVNNSKTNVQVTGFTITGFSDDTDDREDNFQVSNNYNELPKLTKEELFHELISKAFESVKINENDDEEHIEQKQIYKEVLDNIFKNGTNITKLSDLNLNDFVWFFDVCNGYEDNDFMEDPTITIVAKKWCEKYQYVDDDNIYNYIRLIIEDFLPNDIWFYEASESSYTIGGLKGNKIEEIKKLLDNLGISFCYELEKYFNKEDIPSSCENENDLFNYLIDLYNNKDNNKSIEQLNIELKNAVKNEDYELAAKLRDIINQKKTR